MTIAYPAALMMGFAANSAGATEPNEVLPEAIYATGKGCAVIKKTVPEDIETWDFMALYNTDLYAPNFACHFVEAAAGAGGKSWVVKAECQHGDATRSTTIAIRETGKKNVAVAMIDAKGERALGTFNHCGKILTD